MGFVMCNDQKPTPSSVNMEDLFAGLNSVATDFGYGDWIEAMHSMGKKSVNLYEVVAIIGAVLVKKDFSYQSMRSRKYSTNEDGVYKNLFELSFSGVFPKNKSELPQRHRSTIEQVVVEINKCLKPMCLQFSGHAGDYIVSKLN